LLIVLWATQSRRISAPVHDNKGAELTQPVPTPDNRAPAPKEAAPTVDKPNVATGVPPRRHHRMRHDGQISERRPEVAKSEGEIAKEQLMLALHIASASLNEAQRMVKAGE